ncbi:MAG: helix-turn-helix transcriptional regulator [Betaproteobacteria bacterium]|nr:helix-turn-helix transcriptional regulator [Betaproteobacteria bacterium]
MPKHPQTLFGRRLRAARQRAGLPQDRLGVLIGLDESCSSARISRYETGAHEPQFKVAQRIAAALKIPVAYLYCDDDDLAQLLLDLSGLSPAELDQVCAAIRGIRERHDPSLTAAPGAPPET